MIREILEKGFKVVLIGLCLLYILSPIDFIPESLFGAIGLVDDLMAGGIGLLAFLSELKERRREYRSKR